MSLVNHNGDAMTMLILQVPMRRGGNVTLTLDGNASQPNVRMEESTITSSDILASNGLFYTAIFINRR